MRQHYGMSGKNKSLFQLSTEHFYGTAIKKDFRWEKTGIMLIPALSNCMEKYKE